MDIVIALETYDDLFSDFDIRNFSERTISKDFLDEMNLRMSKLDSIDQLRVVFVIPNAHRAKSQEIIILNRIRKFFQYRYTRYCQKDKRIKVRSGVYVLIGLLLLVFANFIYNFVPVVFKDFLLIPSWYFIWSGLDQYLSTREGVTRKKRYYGILSNAELEFKDK